VGVDAGEVAFSGNEEQHCAHGFEEGAAAGLAFGGLEEAAQGLDEAVGLAGLGPGDDAVEVLADQTTKSTSWCFIGSTLERRTLVHHCLSMAETTLICLR